MTEERVENYRAPGYCGTCGATMAHECMHEKSTKQNLPKKHSVSLSANERGIVMLAGIIEECCLAVMLAGIVAVCVAAAIWIECSMEKDIPAGDPSVVAP